MAKRLRGRMIMAVLRIARMGNPVLHKVAEPVGEPRAPEIARLAADMRETLEDIGASGLAAPQIFVSTMGVKLSVSYALPDGPLGNV